MSVKNYSDLNEEHKDVLKELGNIGTGNALTALSQLIDNPIKMNLPTIKIINIENLSQVLDGNDLRKNDNLGVAMRVEKDLEIIVTCLFNEEFSKIIIENLTNEKVEDILSMSEMQKSAACEIGNIMCNAYLNALATMLDVEMDVSVPMLEIGKSEKVLRTFKKDFVDEKTDILFIENTFNYLDEEYMSVILLHPKFDSLIKILGDLEG